MRFGVILVALMLCGCWENPASSPPRPVLPEIDKEIEPLSLTGEMFQPPQGWRRVDKSTRLVFFDAPDSEPDKVTRIAVMSPAPTRGSFEEWFEMVQEPSDIIEISPIVHGTGRGGTQTLRVTKQVVAGRARTPLYRVYHGIRDGDRFALILMTASSKQLLQSHLPAFDAMSASWNPQGQFPSKETPEIEK
jgi:hypothetical protein